MRLAGKVALVTGAGRGFGKGIATLFAAQGARVAVADTDGEAAGQSNRRELARQPRGGSANTRERLTHANADVNGAGLRGANLIGANVTGVAACDRNRRLPGCA